MPDTIIVFSHLRWSFVYQRPQHLLTRMAVKRRVVFFEEPVHEEGCDPYLEISSPEPGITVCRPHTHCPEQGYHDEQFPLLSRLLKKFMRDEKLTSYIAWFYTPMAFPMAVDLTPRLVIYDCMDELSGFLGAPAQLVQRETALLDLADLVFTGGPSLYRAKKDLHPAVHCFPSSVDYSHFSRACDPSVEHQIQKPLPRPRLGYFGVLDERLDLQLLKSMARSHPEWQIVMIGPVVKISPDSLPRLKNIHYFGQQQYADLPCFLAGWDVCLIPFALNEATRFISPTKTLEYMAAEKPVVSTPITDVAVPYGDIVFIGDGIGEFICACQKALAMQPSRQEAMIASMRKVLAGTSWDTTVAAMEALILEAARKAGKKKKRQRGEGAAAIQDASPS